jgi:iron(III) transport system substrate-binding protein
MKRSRAMTLTVGVLAVGLALAACSSGGGGAPGTTAAPTSAAPATSAAPTAAPTTPDTAVPSPTEAVDPLAQFVDAACKEGSITVYASAADATISALLDAFKKAFPCMTTDYFRGAGTALLNKYQTEAEANSVVADVFLPTIQPDFMTKNSKWFLPLTDDVVPVAKNWPAEYRNPLYILSTVEEAGVIYNTNNVKTAPAKWADTIDPKYDGKIILIDPTASPSYMSWWYIIQQKFGDDFLKSAAALHPEWVTTGATGAQTVATGAKDIMIPAYPSHATDPLAQGAPLGLARNLDPTMGITTATAISAAAPHPNAAKLFANWMLTTDGLNVTCGAGNVFSSVVPGTKCRDLASTYVSPVWDIAKADQDKIVSLLGRCGSRHNTPRC